MNQYAMKQWNLRCELCYVVFALIITIYINSLTYVENWLCVGWMETIVIINQNQDEQNNVISSYLYLENT